jgi:signal transduction histidine kinase
MTRRFLVALLAMAFLFSLLVAASVRLLTSENQQRDYITEDMVWLSSQGQYEAVRFADALQSYARGLTTLDEPQLRLDLLSSRITVLEDGETYRQLQSIGHDGDLVGFRQSVDQATEQLLTLQPTDTAAIDDLHEGAQELAGNLRNIANAALFKEREREAMLREHRRHTLFEVLGTLVATTVAGLILAFVLVRDHRNMVSAEAALERERQVSRLHRAFISVVSHQFRTPLAIIDASAQRMIRRGGSMDLSEIAQRAEKIRSACLRLTRLMDSTLNAARLEEGEITLNIRPCDVEALLRHVIDNQPEQDQQRIELVVESLPAWIEADATLLEQAVQNLVSNALKYSPDGERVVIEAQQRADKLRISVTDHGVGIPADEMSSLFRRFFRARTAEGIPGTGIGLSFVEQIMVLHHGRVEAQSVENQGSTFTLRMPVNQPLAQGASKLNQIETADS